MRSYVSTNVRCAAEVSFLDCVRPAFFVDQKIRNLLLCPEIYAHENTKKLDSDPGILFHATCTTVGLTGPAARALAVSSSRGNIRGHSERVQ